MRSTEKQLLYEIKGIPFSLSHDVAFTTSSFSKVRIAISP